MNAGVDTTALQPLLVTPAPFAYESLFGYVLRLTEVNGYDSISTILSYVDSTTTELAHSPGFLHKLALVTGAISFARPEMKYRDLGLPDDSQHALLGKPATYSRRISPFTHERPRLCPQCVNEKGHIEAFWDLRFAVACPTHKALPVAACGCGKKVSWKRRQQNHCPCGQSYRDVAQPVAGQHLVTLMRWLKAKVTGSSGPDDLDGSGFPRDALGAMSLKSLLVLIHLLAEFTVPTRRENKQTSTLCAVTAAAELLQDWPTNFCKFLGKEHWQNVSGPRKKSTGFSSNFGRESLLLDGIKSYSDLAFVSQAYLQYGRDSWDDGIVDERTDGIPASLKRFVSLQGAAVALGVTVTTLSKWQKKGLVPVKGVQAGSAVRYVVDKEAIATLKKPLIKPVHAKQAAAHLGMPVSTLYQLREVGALTSTQPVTRARSFYLPDLDLFLETLCARAQQMNALPDDIKTVSFSHVVNKMKLFSKEGKADFVVAYLEDLVRSVGRTGNSLKDIHFDAEHIKRFVAEKRNHGLADTISQSAAAEELECPWRTIPVLIEFGLLVGVATSKGTRVTHASLVAFKHAYVSLTGIAARFDTTSRRLEALMAQMGLEMLKIPGKPPCDRLFFTNRKNLGNIKNLLK